MTTLGTVRALAPFRRRATLVTFVRAAVVAVIVTLLAVELLTLASDVVEAPVRLTGGAVLALSLIAAAIYARAARPSAQDVARRVDRVAQLQDLVVTAAERDTNDDEISALLARAASAALRQVPASRVYPYEAPRQWRRWSMAVAVVQLIAIGLTWRAPAARPMPASGAALSMPAGGGSGQNASAPPPTPAGATPAASAGAAAAAAAPTQSPLSPGDARAGDAPATAPAAGSGAGASAASPTIAGSADRETGEGPNRYRQAATRASEAIARGRVPAALRSVVERYFTAIRPQGQ